MAKKIDPKEVEYSDKEILEIVGEGTREALKKNRARARKIIGKIKYTKQNPKHTLWFGRGYDLLEYSIVVKPFIYRKYNIKTHVELDALLYLYPKQFFTIKDFNLLGLKQYSIYLKTMIESGYVHMCVRHINSRSQDIYTLTDHAIRIVTEYYAYLSGEKTFNINHMNPFKDSESRKIDELRERVLLRLKNQAETNSLKFKGKLF